MWFIFKSNVVIVCCVFIMHSIYTKSRVRNGLPLLFSWRKQKCLKSYNTFVRNDNRLVGPTKAPCNDEISSEGTVWREFF